MARPRKYSDEAMIAALEKAKGLIYVAARGLKCQPCTIFSRIHISEQVASALQTLRGQTLDQCEKKLFAAMNKGEPWAIMFILRTIGKHRGYVERVQDMPPLEVLLGALPTDIADAVRDAISLALRNRATLAISDGRGE